MAIKKTKKETSLASVSSELVEQKIHLLRSQRVMLDADLAEIYGVEARVLNQAVKRNLQRFPQDFMFQLTDDEFAVLRNSSQFVTSSRKYRGTKYRPYAFTEHGAVMLATVLNSPTAIEASIQVVRAFVRLRTVLATHQDIAKKIDELENKVNKHDKEIDAVFSALRQLLQPPIKPRRQIGFRNEDKKATRKAKASKSK